MKSLTIIISLLLLISYVAADCISNPADPNCVTYIYPTTNVTADISSLCGDMPFMTLCSIRDECTAIQSTTGVCAQFNILADGCADMGGMSGCNNYNSLCNKSVSVVKECTDYPGIPNLTKTMTLSRLVYNICTSMPMDACNQCNIPTTYSMLNCNLLKVYSTLCQQMPNMKECAQWQGFCADDSALATSQLSTVFCSPSEADAVPLMRMFFHTGILDYILFEKWVPRTPQQFAGFWFLVFFFAILFEMEKTLRSLLEKKWESNRTKNMDINADESLVNSGYFRGTFPSFEWKIDVTRGLLHGLELTMSYLLMLVAMTFNVALFFSVIAGTVVGNILVGRFRGYKPKVTCCD